MTLPSSVSLIIFDCDGVLVDSEPLAMRVLLRTIEKAGVKIPAASGFRNYLGRSYSAIAENLDELYGLTLDDAALEAMRLDLYDTYRRELKPMAGLLEVLPALGVPFCVASSSQMERITTSLELTGLSDGIAPRIFSSTMVEHGKPAPDLFLMAAREMGVAPQNCLVIEDSPAGIIAAKKAGMAVFAFTGGGHIAPSGLGEQIAALHPDALFADMRELPGLLEQAQARPSGTRDLLVAVDVGTGSARAGVVSATGDLLGRAERPIEMRRTDANHAEHDSEQIWRAVCAAVHEAMAAAGAKPDDVVGISFDATCSLVVRDRNGAPLPVSDGEARWDTIVWLDHRALAEAAECTATGHRVLDSIGGVMSPEMEVPKLMWLKRHVPETWDAAGHFFDLADFLTWKASGATARSQCTLTCKWTWIGGEGGWQRDFLDAVGLGDMLERGGLPASASAVGTDLGPLTAEAAAALGLTPRCRVGLGLIDAHAGALGTLGAFAGDVGSLDRHLALIAGTSSCVMALSPDPRPIRGVWGPYEGAVLPDAWLNEAGQSATGALLDHLIRWHGAGGEPTPAMHKKIIGRVMELRATEPNLAHRLHVLPDFHGNRSPLADPNALGVISGLTLDTGFDSLCQLYWRAAVGIVLGVRHILETLNARGYAIGTLHVTGGHTHNALLMDLYADATGCTVVEPAAEDATLLGTAMVAATAAGLYGTLNAAAMAMQQGGNSRRPRAEMRAAFDRDYRVFLTMLEQRQAVDGMSL
jgi:FGGY-family pentulose kinase/HAD superfamily hydrolase (TIGR01509 family)